jgi:hypothetical protein
VSDDALRRLCRVLLVLNLLYCALALLVGPRIPSWGMFSRVERMDYSLTDGRGRTVNPYDYMPRGSYILDQASMAAAVSCLCRAHPELRPLRLDSAALGPAGDPCAP